LISNISIILFIVIVIIRKFNNKKFKEIPGNSRKEIPVKKFQKRNSRKEIPEKIFQKRNSRKVFPEISEKYSTHALGKFQIIFQLQDTAN
jgi:hypothetical protein